MTGKPEVKKKKKNIRKKSVANFMEMYAEATVLYVPQPYLPDRILQRKATEEPGGEDSFSHG